MKNYYFFECSRWGMVSQGTFIHCADIEIEPACATNEIYTGGQCVACASGQFVRDNQCQDGCELVGRPGSFEPACTSCNGVECGECQADYLLVGGTCQYDCSKMANFLLQIQSTRLNFKIIKSEGRFEVGNQFRKTHQYIRALLDS